MGQEEKNKTNWGRNKKSNNKMTSSHFPGIVISALHIVNLQFITTTLWGKCHCYSHSKDEEIKTETG